MQQQSGQNTSQDYIKTIVKKKLVNVAIKSKYSSQIYIKQR